jgi:hypothetical protein
MGAFRYTDHYLVVEKFQVMLAVIKETAQKFDVERFNFSKLNELQVRKENQMNVWNRFAALENLNDSEYMNMDWESNKEIMKTLAKGYLSQNGPKNYNVNLDEECLHFVEMQTI